MENHEEEPTVEGVIDELKAVISNLNHEPIAPSIPSPRIEEPIPERPVSARMPEPDSVLSDSSGEEPLGTPEKGVHLNGNGASTQKFPSNGVASDSDFWSGNVLGWPPDMEEKNTTNGHDAVKPAPAPFQVPPPSLQDRAFLSDEIAEPISKPPPVFEPLPAPPVQGETPIAEQISAWNIDHLLDRSPTAIKEGDPETRERDIPEPPTPPVPIPGTMMFRDPPSSKEKDSIDFDGTEIKPKGLVQIACIYPEGEERKGQQFVQKLKEFATKSKATITIDAVFVNAWTNGVVDLTAWKKASLLSGADIMFIITPKKNVDLFKSVTLDPWKDGIKVRVVVLEYLSLRTLYGDVVIELQRGR